MSENMNVLEEADNIIGGARRETYGDAADEFVSIAAAWSAYKGFEITALDYANMMVILKVFRARKGYHRDSYVDICGYSALAEQVNDRATPEPVFDTSAWVDMIKESTLPGSAWGDLLIGPGPGGSIGINIGAGGNGAGGINIGADPSTVTTDDIEPVKAQTWLPGDPPNLPSATTRAVRLTRFLTDTQWVSEKTGLVYSFVDGEWWFMDPEETVEDPWMLSAVEDHPSGGEAVPADEGPFVPYVL